ncbi:helix-turn-helix transcriptional regulator [Clostridium sp. D33t1_170424_F3]|uniref:helix-turn-helix domain-containing protein n=1 Tax=Clostridium sp. D33t1_170424_F3 TaxID=2787099 RepID=UPI002570583C|nr:helix-turn-helix transcriptional regulator [Clostridium sp. D33t1_170424_F3]
METYIAIPVFLNGLSGIHNENKGCDIMFAVRLKCLRKSQGLNQVELAKKIGVKKQSISNWENDNILPSIEMLVRIADYFQVSTDYLLGRETLQYQDGIYLEVTGLRAEQVKHVEDIINDIRNG